MARETKIGLLVGLAFIVLFGIILSGRDATQVTDPAYGPAGSGDIHKVIGRESKAEDGADPFSPWGSSSRTEGAAPETGIVAFGGHVRAATGVPRLPAMRDAAQGTVVAVQPGDTARNEKSLLEPPAQTYVIKRNDSLIRIARRVYG
ncbi:MAG: hypothetical protein QGD94_08420, partial [Planctomycetia bacterium]|nr:hypothetical protein [Planctomycetia bacterium]